MTIWLNLIHQSSQLLGYQEVHEDAEKKYVLPISQLRDGKKMRLRIFLSEDRILPDPSFPGERHQYQGQVNDSEGDWIDESSL